MNEARNNTISRIRTLVFQVVREHPKTTAKLMEALELLETLEGSKKKSGGYGRSKHSIRAYSVEEFQGEDVLCEHRHGDQNPYRCRRDMYDAIAEVLHGMKEPERYDEILSRVETKLNARPPDYVVRMCIRFWLKRKKRLVVKSGARYAPADPSSFKKQAATAWERAKKKE